MKSEQTIIFGFSSSSRRRTKFRKRRRNFRTNLTIFSWRPPAR